MVIAVSACGASPRKVATLPAKRSSRATTSSFSCVACQTTSTAPPLGVGTTQTVLDDSQSVTGTAPVDLAVTLVRVRDPEVGAQIPATSGNRYLAAEFRIRNESPSTAHVAAQSDVRLISPEGDPTYLPVTTTDRATLAPTYMSDCNAFPAPNGISLAPGQEFDGCVAFEALPSFAAGFVQWVSSADFNQQVPNGYVYWALSH